MSNLKSDCVIPPHTCKWFRHMAVLVSSFCAIWKFILHEHSLAVFLKKSLACSLNSCWHLNNCTVNERREMCPTAATNSCLWSCVYSSISLCLSLALPTGCANCADSRFDVDVLYFKRILHMNTDSLQRKLTSNLSVNTSEIQVWSYTIKNVVSHSLFIVLPG